MHFDILFLDSTSPKYYDRISLEKSAMGGTEATVVRIADSLGAFGLKVAVVQSGPEYFEPTMGQFAFYFHKNDIHKLSCGHYIQIRRNHEPDAFYGAKKYLWLHDVVDSEYEGQWKDSIEKYSMTVIGVSQWHRKNILEAIKCDKDLVKYIYNPVEDSIYTDTNLDLKFDKHLLVWTASPHKGLGKALEIFKQIYAKDPRFKLVVMNPGYHQIDIAALSVIPGVNVYGSMPCRNAWGVIQKSLCVFYPVTWKETFGLVAAEANAIGVPIITYDKAGLRETVSTDTQKVADKDSDAIIAKVLDWSQNGRPVVAGNDDFRLSNVTMDWVRLLGR